jgi:hypothetical protein
MLSRVGAFPRECPQARQVHLATAERNAISAYREETRRARAHLIGASGSGRTHSSAPPPDPIALSVRK